MVERERCHLVDVYRGDLRACRCLFNRNKSASGSDLPRTLGAFEERDEAWVHR